LANNKVFMLPVVLGTFLIATVLNSLGMKTSSWVSIIGAIFGTIIPMLFIIGLGIVWVWHGHPLAIKPSVGSLLPDLNHFNNIAFIVVILFSLMGIEMSAVHAGDVKNPTRDFPRALRYSSIIIVSTLTLASLAIAIIVPPKSLSLLSGLNQAFSLFLTAYHLQSLLTVAIILIIFGGFAAMCAWVIGPTKGLMVAAQEGCAPAMFGKTNRHGAPAKILLLQALVVCLLCSLFLCFDNFSTSYWILSDLTAQLALVYYISFFAAAIRLRYKNKTPSHHCYRIPGGKFGIWLVAGVGILSCVGAIILGFVPPSDVPLGNTFIYESILIGGMLLFILPPFFIYRRQLRHRHR
jgi:amino acid transporter